MKYRVEFEFYGTRMNSIVEAESEEDAKRSIRSRIRFNRISQDWKSRDPKVLEMLETIKRDS